MFLPFHEWRRSDSNLRALRIAVLDDAQSCAEPGAQFARHHARRETVDMLGEHRGDLHSVDAGDTRTQHGLGPRWCVTTRGRNRLSPPRQWMLDRDPARLRPGVTACTDTCTGATVCAATAAGSAAWTSLCSALVRARSATVNPVTLRSMARGQCQAIAGQARDPPSSESQN